MAGASRGLEELVPALVEVQALRVQQVRLCSSWIGDAKLAHEALRLDR